MKIYRKLAIWLIVVLMAFNVGCGAAVSQGMQIAPGMVEALHVGSTVQGVTGCVQGVQGTSIMKNVQESLVLLSWTYQDGNVGFVILDAAKGKLLPYINMAKVIPGMSSTEGLSGNITGFETWRSLTDYLTTKGWQYAVPIGSSAEALTVTFLGWLQAANPTFIFFVAPTWIDGAGGYDPILGPMFPEPIKG